MPAESTPLPAAAVSGRSLLAIHQRLATSGARTALPFRIGDALYLAVPQLARDVADTPAHMNGGDSDVDALLYRWRDGGFVEDARLPVPGGEDICAFSIGGDDFLAAASVRSGSGPYEYNIQSTLYRRDGADWHAFQTIDTFAAKQFHAFAIDGRHFLGLAQGVTLPHLTARHPGQSLILEWTGERFAEFQRLDGRWGYNFADFACGGHRFLAYADHTGDSLLYRWQDGAFVPFQTLAAHGGRAFRFFERDGDAWLAFATIDGGSTLFRWDGERFAPHQILGGPGGREFALIETATDLYLVRIRFIEGSPAAPKTDLVSHIDRWNGAGFDTVESFPTQGGTDAAAFEADGQLFLAVSNSLTPDLRFRADTIIYRLDLPPGSAA